MSSSRTASFVAPVLAVVAAVVAAMLALTLSRAAADAVVDATALADGDVLLDAIVHNASDSPQTRSNSVASASQDDDTYLAWREGNRVAVRAIRDHGLTEDVGPVFVDPDGPGRLTSEPPGIAAWGDDVYVTWSEGVLDPAETRYERWVWEVFVAVSHDRGATFGPPEQVSDEGRDPAYRPKLALSDEVVAVVWEAAGSNLVLSERPTAGGRWLVHPVGRAGNGEYEIAVQGPAVHVAWIDAGVLARHLPEPGADLSPPVVVGGAGNGARHPDLAVHGTDVAIGWIEYEGNGGTATFHPIWVATSTDAGRTFTRTQVNDRAHSCGRICGGPGPQVGIAAGRFHAVYSGGASGMHEAIVAGGALASLTPIGTGSPALGIVHDVLVTDLVVVVAYTRQDPNTHRDVAYDAARRHGSGSWVVRTDSRGGIASRPVVAPLGFGGDYTVAWDELSLDGGTAGDDEVLLRPGSYADRDLAALSVTPVQAANDASRLVAGKPTAFRARVRSGFPMHQRVIVHWTVDDGDGTPLEDAEEVILRPGAQTITYVPPAPFELAPGTVDVEVTFDSSQAVRETDEENNAVTHGGLPVVATADHDVLYVPLTDGDFTVPCRDVQLVEATTRPFLDAVWPADPDLSRSQASCATRVEYDADVFGGTRPYAVVLAELVDQLEPALAQWDQVVVVAPAHWIGAAIEEAKPGTLGVANVGSGGGVVIVDRRGIGGTLVAHELSHDRLWVEGPIDDGGDNPHHASDHPAPGWWVERSIAVEEHDFMHPTNRADSAALQSWISPETWEYLLDHGAAGTELPVAVAAGSGLAVHGVVLPDGSVESGTWREVDATPTASSSATDGVTVAVLDAEGAELTSVDLGLSIPAEVDPATVTGGRAFTGVVPVAGAAAVEVRVDGVTRLRRDRSASTPTVRLTAPAPGAVVAPGGEISVAWTASDADGDELEADLELSTDGGTTWVPTRSRVTASSATLLVTPELEGDVLVRVTVTDGWNVASTTSQPVAIEAGVSNGRVAFTRHPDQLPNAAELWTAAVDGSDARLLLSRQQVPGQTTTPPIAASAWSPDGRQLAVDLGFANDLAVLDADGSDLRRLGLTQRFRSPRNGSIHISTLACPTWSPGGGELAFVETGYGPEGTMPLGPRIWAVRPDGTELRLVYDGSFRYGGSPCGLAWADGPAGERIWFAGRPNGGGAAAIESVRPDGSDQRRLLTAPSTIDAILSLDVSPDGGTVAYAYGTPVEQIWVAGTDGTAPVQLTRMPFTQAETARVRDMAWAPDGRSLLAHVYVETWSGSGPSTRNDRLERIDALTGERTPFAVAAGSDDRQPAWQPVPTPPGGDGEPLPIVRGAITEVTDAVEGEPTPLDASGSQADAGIAEIRWDLDGDGQHDDAFGPTPTPTFPDDGEVPVSVEVIDQLGQSAFFAAVVVVVDAPPAIADAQAVVRGIDVVLDARVEHPADDPITGEVTWPDGETSTANAVRDANGSWRITATRPASSAITGTATLVVDDGDGGTDSAEVALTPAPENQGPTLAVGGVAETPVDVPVEVPVEIADPDGSTAEIRLVVVQPPAHGTVAAPSASGVVLYAPAPGYAGSDAFRLAAIDAEGATSARVDVTVTVIGAPAPDDDTGPVVTITSPVDGSSVPVGSSLVAQYTCVDETSSDVRCEGTLAAGSPVDTSAPGTFVFTVEAEDEAANVTSATATYTVVEAPPAGPSGRFDPPVANGEQVNWVNAGRTVPLKWRAASDVVVRTATSTEVACSTWLSVEEARPLGTDAVRQPDDVWLLEWVTDRAWTRTCRVVDVVLSDGTTLSARFRLG